MNSSELKEYVFWLQPKVEYTLNRHKGFTQTVWAKTPEEGKEYLKSWETMYPFGYNIQFLHSMEDFKKECEEKEKKLKDSKIQTMKYTKAVEVESV